MQITLNPVRAGAPAASQQVGKKRSLADGQDSASLEKLDALKAALDKTPAVRPEKVAAARALVSDPKFPSDGALKDVASLIADKL